jgi:O-antigen/teichoic acid export membrane protein
MKGLLKAVMQSGIASAGSLLAAVISAKIYAVTLGQEYNGLARTVNSFISVFATLATMAGAAAFIQGASTRKDAERWRFVKAVTKFYGLGSIAVALFMLAAAPFLAWKYLEIVPNSIATVRLCAPLIVVSAFVGLATAMLQVEEKMGAVAKMSLVSALAMVGLAFVAAPLYVEYGFWLMPLVHLAGQLAMLAMLAIAAVKQKWASHWRNAGRALPLTSLKAYWGLTAASLIGAEAFYYSQLEVSSRANDTFALHTSGAIAVAMTMCAQYTDLFLRSLSQVYLPRLSAESGAGRQALLNQFFRYAVLFGLPLVLGVAVFREFALRVLFHSSYENAGAYVGWMLPGDLLKMFSWLYSMVLLGAGDARRSLMGELLYHGGFLVISLVCIQRGFSYGPCLAFSVMYAVFLIYNVEMARRHHGVRLPLKNALLIAGMTALVVMTAWWTA